MSNLSEKDVYAKTVYAEARGEPSEGQEWVAWVIKNRAHLNKSYWGGSKIKGVCLHYNQFECWWQLINGKLVLKSDIEIDEQSVYEEIESLTDRIHGKKMSADPTGGADHYNNPDKEAKPDWVDKCAKIKKIGGHQFYRTKPEYR